MAWYEFSLLKRLAKIVYSFRLPVLFSILFRFFFKLPIISFVILLPHFWQCVRKLCAKRERRFVLTMRPSCRWWQWCCWSFTAITENAIIFTTQWKEWKKVGTNIHTQKSNLHEYVCCWRNESNKRLRFLNASKSMRKACRKWWP